MSHEKIPRENACFYWNDIPSGIPGEDVLVLSFDDPDRDRKSAHFENSTGAPLLAGFLEHESAESIFTDYLGGDYMQSLQPQFFIEVCETWEAQFQKVEGFRNPFDWPKFDRIRLKLPDVVIAPAEDF